MRRGMKPEWLEDGGKVIGLNLSADYCAEHEWGIGKLKRILGVDGAKAQFSRERAVYTKAPGLPRRMISRHDSVRLYKHRKAAVLLCRDTWRFEEFEKYVAKEGMAKAFKERIPSDLRGCGALRTAWDGDEFGIYAEEEFVKHLLALWEAFQRDGIAIWQGGQSTPFENSGLVLCIADLIPKDKAEMLMDGDVDNDRLLSASDATGIYKRLEAAGKGYFACSPRWLTDDKKKSAHPVIYWLNPMEQDRNSFGWYTVEELDQWIEGRGPIPRVKV